MTVVEAQEKTLEVKEANQALDGTEEAKGWWSREQARLVKSRPALAITGPRYFSAKEAALGDDEEAEDEEAPPPPCGASGGASTASMSTYPSLEDLLSSGASLTACHWPGCGKTFGKFRQLVSHIKKTHNVTKDEMKDHWVHEEEWRERNPATISEQELDHVALVWTASGDVDEASITCTKCAVPLRKGAAARHMCKAHHLEEGDVKAWNTQWDATLIANTAKRAAKARLLGLEDEASQQEAHCRARLRLTCAILHAGFGQDGPGEGAAWARASGGAAPPMGTEPQAASPPPCSAAGPPPGPSLMRPKPKPVPRRGVSPAAEDPDAVEDRLALRQIKAYGRDDDMSPQPATIGLDAASLAAISHLTAALSGPSSSRVAAALAGAPGGAHPPRLVEVAINDDAERWTYTQDEAYRHAWPLPPKEVDLSAFHEYITSTVGLVEETAAAHVLRMKYFFSVFDFPSGADLCGVLASIFKSNLSQRAVKLGILHPERPITNSILVALSRYIDFARVLCAQNDWAALRKDLDNFWTAHFGPLKARAQRDSKGSGDRKLDYDEERVGNFAPSDVNRAGVENALIDLHTIWLQVVESGEPAPIEARRAANIIMMGLTYCNMFGGRPGEWEKLKRAQVEEFLASGESYLTLVEHKTDRTHGKLGRHVPPGNIAAMKKVLDIHPPDSKRFFAVTGGTRDRVMANALLLRYGRIYLPGYEHPGPTLSRKYFTTEAADDDNVEKAKAVVAEVNAHRASTAARNYNVLKPAKLAMKGAVTFKIYRGDPLSWPSDEQLDAKREESLARVAKAFKGRASRDLAEADEGDEGDEDIDVGGDDGGGDGCDGDAEGGDVGDGGEEGGDQGPGAPGGAPARARKRGEKKEKKADKEKKEKRKADKKEKKHKGNDRKERKAKKEKKRKHDTKDDKDRARSGSDEALFDIDMERELFGGSDMSTDDGLSEGCTPSSATAAAPPAPSAGAAAGRCSGGSALRAVVVAHGAARARARKADER